MLDIKLIRSNPDKIRMALKDRGGRYLPAFEEVLKKDAIYKNLQCEIESLRSKRNKVSQKIQELKASKKDEECSVFMTEANKIKESMKSKEEEFSKIEKELELMMLGLPNFSDESVPKGKSPEENKVIFESLNNKKDFSFKPLDHHSIGEKLGIIDFHKASMLSGSRFALLKGQGAKLERSLIQFMLDIHVTKNGYTEIFPPHLVTAETMTGTGHLPKFEEELYRTFSSPPLYLIPTGEVPLTNLHKNEILPEKILPIKYVAYTACYRQEAGSYGKDTKGLIRNHQFNKVELVWFTKPEDSMNALEQLTRDAEKILQLLKLPYRIVELCTGDLGFASTKSYDLEVWMPGEGRFREISSCSNCSDFQARRMNIRFKRKNNGKPEFVHTLNGSGVAIGRTFAAILENYQNEDGTITVPEVLRPYMYADKIGVMSYEF